MKCLLVQIVLFIAAQLLAGCTLLPRHDDIRFQGQRAAVSEGAAKLGADDSVVPDAWLLYHAPRSAFSMYHPVGWNITHESAATVTFTAKGGAEITLAFTDARCGIGQDDLSIEDILSCLVQQTASLIDGVLLASDIAYEQGRLLYALSYRVGDTSVLDMRRHYLLFMALPEQKMVSATFTAAVLGPRTLSELWLAVASVRAGKAAARRVTPTLQPTAAVTLATEPLVTPLPDETPGPVSVPLTWVESVCVGCAITFYRPAAWVLLREEGSHQLWRAQDDGLVVIGSGLAPCGLASREYDKVLACLARERTGQAPEDADYVLLASGVAATDSTLPVYWLYYRSSTPDDYRPLVGLAFHRLLDDHRLLTVEYANLVREPTETERQELLMLVNAVRLQPATRLTPVPTPEPTLSGRPGAAPTLSPHAWLLSCNLR